MEKTFIIIVVTFTVVLRSTAGCPFPGIPKNGEGKVNNTHVLKLSSNTSFYEQDFINYTCSSGWMHSIQNHTNITCQHDKIWTGEVPKCHPVLKPTDWFKDFFTIYPTGTKSVRDETFSCNKIQYSFIRLVRNALPVDISKILELHVHLCPRNGNGNGKKGKFHVNLTSVDGTVIGTDLVSQANDLEKIFKIKTSVTSNLTLKDIEITVVTNPIYIKDVFMLMKSDDYCGVPPVPVNSIVEESEPPRYKLKCIKGGLVGNDVITCNQNNGQWSPIPVCESNNSSSSIGTGGIIGAVFGAFFGIALIVIVAISGYKCKQRQNRGNVHQTTTENSIPMLP